MRNKAGFYLSEHLGLPMAVKTGGRDFRLTKNRTITRSICIYILGRSNNQGFEAPGFDPQPYHCGGGVLLRGRGAWPNIGIFGRSSVASTKPARKKHTWGVHRACNHHLWCHPISSDERQPMQCSSRGACGLSGRRCGCLTYCTSASRSSRCPGGRIPGVIDPSRRSRPHSQDHMPVIASLLHGLRISLSS